MTLGIDNNYEQCNQKTKIIIHVFLLYNALVALRADVPDMDYRRSSIPSTQRENIYKGRWVRGFSILV